MPQQRAGAARPIGNGQVNGHRMQGLGALTCEVGDAAGGWAVARGAESAAESAVWCQAGSDWGAHEGHGRRAPLGHPLTVREPFQPTAVLLRRSRDRFPATNPCSSLRRRNPHTVRRLPGAARGDAEG
ncbi:hypothetical protein SCOCK_30279 [Actinacidiphila cocklensis]|uniref:Uncharacterized protein n=1 Tax=Actinacidiphila cocklensis TaxID=887465 RepID=A0A9W4GSR8_9ACTN|nr:hypothetical protein SCOCK_30279 [Actinacidiphila cocklensis]